LQVTLQHHFASNAHAYRLLILKEHRIQYYLTALLTSFSRQQQRSEILICFLLRRQVFLKISFRNTQQLGFLHHRRFVRFRSLRQQQRGEILICFRSVVKYF